MSDWISVKDRLPEIDSDYLVFANNAIHIMIWYKRWHSFLDLDGLLNDCDVTHWMPLPEPPKQ